MTRTRRRKLMKLIWVKNEIQMMIALTLMMKWVLTLYPLGNQSTSHLFEDLTDDEDDFTHT
jgi:hypothetical protein